MKVAAYIVRFLLVLLFASHGIEKLFTTADQGKFAGTGMDRAFIDFYMMLEYTGYLKFVGLFQLLCALLLLPARTCLLAAVMLVPMILCLIATHLFMSHNTGYIIFDTAVLVADLFLIYPAWNELKKIFLKPQLTWI